jgi:hypothetical protein
MNEVLTEKEIKLDFDSKRLPIERIKFVCRFLRLDVDDVQVHKTVRKWKPNSRKSDYGWHVRISLEKPLPIYIIGYVQTLMGSDWKRECYNFIRIVNLLTREIKSKIMSENWNVLFNRKYLRRKLASVEEFDHEMTRKLRKELCTTLQE